MSIRILKGNRTWYRNLLEKEQGKGKHLLEEDREEMEVKVLIQNVNNCINRLNDFQKKLEDTGIQISTIVDGQDGEDEIVELIKADWDYISTVMDCRDDILYILASSDLVFPLNPD